MRKNVVILSLLGIALLVAPGSAAAKRTSRGFRYCADANAVYKGSRDFVGDGDALVVVQSPQLRNCSFGLMAAHNLGYYRFQLNWGVVEFSPGFYNFVPYDQLVTLAAEHHMRMLFDLIGEPSWESSAPPGAKARAPYPPRDPDAFARFAALAVQRYGPGGTFWRAHPNVPYYPVRTWEVWQEMNLKQSWADPNMRAYVRLLRPTYTAIKGVDRGSTVIAGGMSFNCDRKGCWGPKSDEWRLITNLYRYGARGYFDALGIHPYATTLHQAEQRLLVARRLMNQHGDRSKGLWITELGWSGGDPDSFITNARKQRSNIVKFFHWAEHTRARLKLRGVIWYGWQDKIYAKGPTNWWGFHLGLLNTRRQPKPALAAISAAARVLNRW